MHFRVPAADLVVVAIQLAHADAFGVQARGVHCLESGFLWGLLMQHCQGIPQHPVALCFAASCTDKS